MARTPPSLTKKQWQLVERHWSYVQQFADRMARQFHVDFDRAQFAAEGGMMEAAKMFDPTMPRAKFKRFANRKMLWAILHMLRATDAEPVVSMDSLRGDGDVNLLAGMVDPKAIDPHDAVAHDEIAGELLDGLQPRTLEIIGCRADGMTLEAIARRMGLTRQRVQQILEQARDCVRRRINRLERSF